MKYFNIGIFTASIPALTLYFFDLPIEDQVSFLTDNNIKGVLLALFSIFGLGQAYQESDFSKHNDPPVVEQAQENKNFQAGTPTLTLPKSDINEFVMSVQKSLVEDHGFIDLKPDGVTGPKTVRAIKLFQEMKGLKVDGIVGPETGAVLFRNLQDDNSL